MTHEPSPRPWRVIDKPNGQLVLYTSIVKNSDGRDVAFVCRSADAALIVDAVNERDRLRDLVKRLITVRENVFWRKDEKTGMMCETCLMDEDEARKTIEEAKAAIKEDGE